MFLYICCLCLQSYFQNLPRYRFILFILKLVLLLRTNLLIVAFSTWSFNSFTCSCYFIKFFSVYFFTAKNIGGIWVIMAFHFRHAWSISSKEGITSTMHDVQQFSPLLSSVVVEKPKVISSYITFPSFQFNYSKTFVSISYNISVNAIESVIQSFPVWPIFFLFSIFFWVFKNAIMTCHCHIVLPKWRIPSNYKIPTFLFNSYYCILFWNFRRK